MYRVLIATLIVIAAGFFLYTTQRETVTDVMQAAADKNRIVVQEDAADTTADTATEAAADMVLPVDGEDGGDAATEELVPDDAELEAMESDLPRAFFVNLKHGDVVKSPFKVEFGLEGMTVAPAGTYEDGTGHFHLLINTKLDEEFLEDPIPADDNHLHFGDGSTETELTLEPGEYTLQIVMGDGDHVVHTPSVMSDIITITVSE